MAISAKTAVTAESFGEQLAHLGVQDTFSGPDSLHGRLKGINAEVKISDEDYVRESVTAMLFPLDMIVALDFPEHAESIRNQMWTVAHSLVAKILDARQDLASWLGQTEQRCLEYALLLQAQGARDHIMPFATRAALAITGDSDMRVVGIIAVKFTGSMKVLRPVLNEYEIKLSARTV